MLPNRGVGFGFVGIVVLAFAISPALANRPGPGPGHNGSIASGGVSCEDCHGNVGGSGSVQIIGLPSQYAFNVIYNLTVRVADPTQAGAGFQVSAESPIGAHLGTLIRTDMANTQLVSSFIYHTATGVNNSVANWNVLPNMQSATYNFQWRSPMTDAGPITFWVAGNAINNDFFNSGDHIYLLNTTITALPPTGACCEDATGFCLDGQTQIACEGMIGFTYRGNGTLCMTLSPPCGPPRGSCCDNLNGDCTDDVFQNACLGPNLTWTEGVDCADLNPPCQGPPTGACCVIPTMGDPFCLEDLEEAECLNQVPDPGTWFEGQVCAQLPPPCGAGAPPPPIINSDGFNRNRTISIEVPGSVAAGPVTQALRVFFVDLHDPNPPNAVCCPAPDFSSFNGEFRWVGPPAVYTESTSNPTTFTAAQLQCDPYYHDWSTISVIHAYGDGIVPSSDYDVQTIDFGLDIGVESNYSAPGQALTSRWGDVVDEFCYPGDCPTTQPDFVDISGIVDKFKGLPSAVIKARGKLQPTIPNMGLDVDFLDISACVDAFKGLAYPYSGPSACP